MSERVVTKSARWSVGEWAEVEEAALGVGVAPATFVREVVLGVVRGGPPAAAGKGYETEAVAAPPVPNVGVLRGVSPEPPDLMVALKESLDRVRRPEGSAGSVSAAVPPAAARPSGAGLSPSSGPAPGRALVVEVAAGLSARFGARADHAATAARMVSTGRVSVDGVVCTDPARPVVDGEELTVA